MGQTALTVFDFRYVANNSPAWSQLTFFYQLGFVIDSFARGEKHLKIQSTMC